MCYGDDAQAPAPPERAPLGSHGEVVLTSADGTRFGAYHADPETASDQAIVILPDARGLHTFYHDLAKRWAEAGRHAIAIDYFGRTAGIGPRGEDFPYREHMRGMDLGKIAEDASAAVAWLRERTGARSVFVVGFCIGGAMSWRQAAAGDDLAGVIGFYGIPSPALDAAPAIASPVLVMAAGKDFTPVEDTRNFADTVRREAGVDVTFELFPDAPHSFFDQAFGQYRADVDRAWRVQLDFLDRHSVPA
ncbi:MULTISPECIES: dienelactone hydrolase family protein [Catenuloplanes]|uniref:Carboxymethylenebutenolidase n=1 Tax=Catenuloplanes niger TaxID=587534 RepID=A0AAE4CUV9_9ACTN|nr:dienelactone hydrolase family protein [Catenuloplanes niger]MDR7326771.1 carboxymethylenebutenolidase [Catenuloplanes niger]